MFTHKIISKEFENGVLVLGVEFTDGVTVITEAVKPQDEGGLKHWLRERLASLNSLAELEKVEINATIDPTEVPPVDKRTQAEKDEAQWFRQISKLRAFQELKALGGMPPGWQADLDALALKVQTDAKKAYLNNL